MPSTGSALTGRSSPRPAIISAVTVRTNSGALAGTTAGSSRAEVTRPGISIWCSPASARSMAASFRAITSAPRRAYVLASADLILAIASSLGSTPEMAKKQVCSTVLVRPASPASRAIRPASIAYTSIRLARIFSWTGRGSASQTSSGGCEQLSSSFAPGAARPSTSTRSSSPNW